MLRPEALAHPLTPVLRRVRADSCPDRLNFHCHTICSDGSLAPEDLASEAVAIGLEHLAVTDHHALGAYGAIASAFDAHRRRGESVPTLWRGVEISCLLEGCLVHVLGLGFDGTHPTLHPYLQGTSVVGPALRADAVVRAIRDAGGWYCWPTPPATDCPTNGLSRRRRIRASTGRRSGTTTACNPAGSPRHWCVRRSRPIWSNVAF